MSSILEMKDLKKSFGKHVLFEKLNMEVQKGELLAIVGPSGCGKSTLLNILGLIETPDSGNYILFGKESPSIHSSAARILLRDHISYVFQNFALVENMTVKENLMLALQYTKYSKGHKFKLIQAALEQVGILSLENEKVYTLSGGEVQRVSLVRTMI